MTATIVYDKSVFDVNSVVSDEGRYKFTIHEEAAADDGAGDGMMMKKEDSSEGSGDK